MVEDRVCGMVLDEKKSIIKSFYKGKTYYFCSVTCKKHFDHDPREFIKE